MSNLQTITITSQTGFSVSILPFGATITAIMAKDKNGIRKNVVLAYEHLNDYMANHLYLGCIVGPVAGRTEKGLLPLGDVTAKLDTSHHPNALHSGSQGLSFTTWSIGSQTTDQLVVLYETRNHIELEGTITYRVTYTVTQESLEINYHVTCSHLTYLSLTNHTYFNLSGQEDMPLYNHQLSLDCSHFARLNADSLPQNLVPLEGSVFNMPQGTKLGDVLNMQNDDLVPFGGIDHPLKCTPNKPAAYLYDPDSGRQLKVTTSQPYVVIYTGNFLHTYASPSGKSFGKQTGICFETQDLPNVLQSKLDKANLVGPDQPYTHSTTFNFSVKED